MPERSSGLETGLFIRANWMIGSCSQAGSRWNGGGSGNASGRTARIQQAKANKMFLVDKLMEEKIKGVFETKWW